MNSIGFFDLEVTKIDLFAKKSEDAGFDFTCVNRRHDGIVHFLSGSAELCVNGYGKYLLKGGDTAVFVRGENYRFYSAEGCQYVTSGFMFSDESMQYIRNLPKVIRSNRLLCDKILRMESAWQKQLPDRYLVCKIELLSLYLEYFRLMGEASVKRYGEDVDRAIRFIHDNYKTDFSAREIADYCNLSPSYLRASFKRSVGVTITEYRDRLRFSSACELLTGGFSIKETAQELGFCDVYYFSKFFKVNSGLSPASYVRMSAIPKGGKIHKGEEV